MVQAILCTISGILLQRPSLIGRIGIRFVYKEYTFLRTWWKGALVLFACILVITLLLSFLRSRLSRQAFTITGLVILILGLAGLGATYYDFRNTTTHRWLGEKFHLGFYLFWLTWLGTVLYFLFKPRLHENQHRDPALQNHSQKA